MTSHEPADKEFDLRASRRESRNDLLSTMEGDGRGVSAAPTAADAPAADDANAALFGTSEELSDDACELAFDPVVDFEAGSFTTANTTTAFNFFCS